MPHIFPVTSDVYHRSAAMAIITIDAVFANEIRVSENELFAVRFGFYPFSAELFNIFDTASVRRL